MAKKIINQIICTILIAALLVPSFEVSAKAEEVTEEEISEELIIDDEILEDEIIGDEIIEDEPAEELIIPVVEFDCEDSEETIAEEAELVFSNDSEEQEDDSDLFFGYREIPVEVEFERLADAVEEKGDISLMGELPSSYITSNLPSTRNQGSYGSCWAHAAMACAEINQGYSSNDYSELHYAYFVYNTPSDPLGGLDGDSNGLNSSINFLQFGGDTVAASSVLASWVGPANESIAPYSDASKVLDGSKTISNDIAYSDAVHIRDYYLTDPVGDRETTKRLIMDYGAVAASFCALTSGKGVRDNETDTVYWYEDALNQSTNSYYLPATTVTNHAITLVGWDDNYSASNFVHRPSENGAWLVRNSWKSGETISSRDYKTYFWLSYYDKSIHSEAVAYITENADKYDNNYQYDGAMADTVTNKYNYKNANVFTASASDNGEKLEAVAFATPNALTNYTIDIYTGVNDGKPISGVLSATLKGRTTYPGYHTVELDRPILLEKGEKFSVVVYFDDPSVRLFAEHSYSDSNGYNIIGHIDEGESFYENGDIWTDYKKDSRWTGGNLRIKAFTTNNDSPAPKYTVSFDANEGSCSVTSKQVTLGKKYGTLPTPTRTGYGFDGWYTEKSGGTKIEDSSMYDISGDSILYAHWTPISIKVSFNVNGGSFSISPINVRYGDAYGTLVTPARSGYSFAGWYDSSSGGNKITSTSIMTRTSNHTLYARWAKIITITFDANGGTVSPASMSSVTGETYGMLPTPTREGYDFAGWYNGGFEVTESTVISSTSNHSLTAHWNPNNYTVSFNPNGGSCSTSSKSVTFNSLYGTLPTPTRTGYSFDGWYNSKNVKITDYSTVTIASDHTLTAHWTVAKCTVSFDANGGSSVGSVQVTYGEKYGDLPTPTKRGCFFDGWFTEKSGGTRVTMDTEVSKASNHTLYAHWTAKKVYVTFDANGGTCSLIKSQVIYGVKYGELPTPTRNGYTFDGWYTGETGGAKVTADTVVDAEDDFCLYAHWIPQTITVYLMKDDVVVSYVIYVVYGGKYGELPKPVKNGYVFDGWFTEKSGGTQITSSSTVTMTDVFYPHWHAAAITVHFDVNDKNAVCEETYKDVIYKETYGELPTPIMDGYEFTGWYTKSAMGEGDKIESNSTVNNYQEHTLYARWNAITFEISFDPNGGMCDTEPKQVTFDGEYGELPTATRFQCDFEGWYTKPEGGTLITAESVLKYAGNQTLYAHWTDRRGDITEEDRNDLIKKYGEEFVVPKGLWIAGLTVYEESTGWIPKRFTYTASQIKPEIRVYDGNKLLKEKTDYTVTFKNNVNVATADQTNAKGISTAPTVVVTGKGNYKGSDSATFEIVPKSIEDEDVIISEPATVLFNKKDQKPVPAITYGKSKLSTKKDYSVRYYLKNEEGENPELDDFANKTEVIPRDAGMYYILLTANEGGNYCGYDIKTFTIEESGKVLVSKLKVNKIAAKQYTGSELYPENSEFVIKNGKEMLNLGTDYEVSYVDGADYTNIGTVKVVITGLGKYVGSREITYSIVGRQMKSVKIENFVKSFGYDGSEKVQDNLELTFKDKGEVVPEVLDSDDYVVSYSNNINAGTATMILTGINGYTGVVKKTFKINPYVINSADEKLSDLFTVEKLDDKEYDPSDIPCFKYEKSGTKPIPKVVFNVGGEKVELEAGKDYTVSYSNNTNVNDGTNPKKIPTIKITGKGNFKGTDATTFFTISQAELNDESVGIKINVPDKVFANKAGNWKSAATVTDAKGKKLAEKTDYTVRYSYENVTNVYDGKTKNSILRTKGETVGDKDLVPAGTVIRVTITGAGKNYAAGDDFALSSTYRIAPKDISKLKASVKDVVYTGKEILPDKKDIIFSGETPNDDEYEIIAYANNVNKGKASVTIRGLGDNYGGSKTINFNIVTKKFSWWPW